jgi:hypothetical protein
MDPFEVEHPIRDLFAEALHRNLSVRLGLSDEQVETYLTDLLIEFMHRDRIFAIRDAAGRRVESIAAMLAEGDVRLNAQSFEREREVHKHVGDYLLFCGGMFPELLEAESNVIDIDRQGRESYFIASTFSHQPYQCEAPLLGKLSAEFPAYRYGLRLVRDSIQKAA